MNKRSIILAVTVVVAAVLVGFIRGRIVPLKNDCVKNLRQLDAAKRTWALENRAITKDVPTWDNLRPYLSRPLVCPQGGKYTLGAVCEPPTCSFGGSHKLPQ